MTVRTRADTVQADRVREAEAYDLRTVQQTQVIAVDCPTSRLLAVGAAALGAEAILVSRRGATSPHEGFLVGGGHSAGRPSVDAFIGETLGHWFPDARVESVTTTADRLAGLLDACRDGAPRRQLLVLPAEPWAMMAACDLLLEGPVRRRANLAIRVVAAGAEGCCIVRPVRDDYDMQVEALLETAGRAEGTGVHADAAMIAAGTLLHELRLLAGATIGDATEAFPMSPVCRLRLPAPPEGISGRRRWVCVGAGGIGSALCLFGLPAVAGAGDHILLVDGDVAEPHNLLLHRHAGTPKVEAVREELRRMLVPFDVSTLAEMVDETTTLPADHDLLLGVTDSAGSRLAAQEAFFQDEREGVMVSAGSTLTGTEGFYVGGPARAACIRCRLPEADAEAEAGAAPAACSRRPASFASNLVAAGLALALARRSTDDLFCDTPQALSRFGLTTHCAERFNTYLPQRCTHWG